MVTVARHGRAALSAPRLGAAISFGAAAVIVMTAAAPAFGGIRLDASLKAGSTWTTPNLKMP